MRRLFCLLVAYLLCLSIVQRSLAHGKMPDDDPAAPVPYARKTSEQAELEQESVIFFVRVEYDFYRVPLRVAVTKVRFNDVSDDSPYKSGIYWAAEANITNGTSETTFSPQELCSRAQIVTFIWRSKGRLPSSDVGYADMRTVNADYFNAANWAYHEGLELGNTNENMELIFEPSTPCTRLQAVTYLWRMAGAPFPHNRELAKQFEDVIYTDTPQSREEQDAISWAIENGITNGTTSSTFSPDKTCNRGQIATFLYRYYHPSSTS